MFNIVIDEIINTYNSIVYCSDGLSVFLDFLSPSKIKLFTQNETHSKWKQIIIIITTMIILKL